MATNLCFTCRSVMDGRECPNCNKILAVWYGQAPDGQFFMLDHEKFADYMRQRGRLYFFEGIHFYEFNDGVKFVRSIRAAMQANLPGLVAQMVKARVWDKS